MAGFSSVKDSPSSYSVTSPSNVTKSMDPLRARLINWAELSVRRMSLNDGGTKRLELIFLRSSWNLKAASSKRGVKKVLTLGTRCFNFDLPGVPRV